MCPQLHHEGISEPSLLSRDRSSNHSVHTSNNCVQEGVPSPPPRLLCPHTLETSVSSQQPHKISRLTFGWILTLKPFHSLKTLMAEKSTLTLGSEIRARTGGQSPWVRAVPRQKQEQPLCLAVWAGQMLARGQRSPSVGGPIAQAERLFPRQRAGMGKFAGLRLR